MSLLSKVGSHLKAGHPRRARTLAIISRDTVTIHMVFGLKTWARLCRLTNSKSAGPFSRTPSVIQTLSAERRSSPRKCPERDGELEYPMRSSHEPHERVVRESQLRGAP
jgi:hypothetical protein